MPSTRLPVRLLSVGLLPTVVLMVAVTATPSVAADAAPAQSNAPVMVVLDASGSMTTADAPGRRIDAAKGAVRNLVAALPSRANVGLEVYGTSTSSAGSAKTAGCRDIKTLVPVGPVNKRAFIAKVDSIKASGYTPIGNALKAAANALPREGARSIVLVSDGIDTCAPPDPCDVAKQLKAQGVDLTVHTVGFKVDAKARAQLQCVAASTGGTYHDASDGAGLTQQLQKQVERALRGYQASGVPIAGGATARTATPISPGQYVDTYDRGAEAVGGKGTVKYYRIQVRSGWTPYVAATIIPPARKATGAIPFLYVTVRLSSPGGSFECVEGSDLSTTTYGAMSATTGVAVGKPASSNGCLKPGTAIVEVDRRSSAYADEPLKMELAFRLEPPADTAGLPGAATPQTFVDPPASGAVSRIESGSSFNDAPELAAGRYADSVVGGETRYVKVHVGWGQRVTYRFRFPHAAGVTGVLDGISGIASIANPMRENIYQVIGSGSNINAFIGAGPVSLQGSAGFVARYTNRSSLGLEAPKYSLEGDYYIVLRTGYGTSSARNYPYTLEVGVIGTPERGPVYETAGTGAATSTPPSSTSHSATRSVGSAGSSASTVGQAATAGGGSSTPLVIGVLAAAVALAAGAGAFMWRRRRTNGVANAHR